MGKLMAFNVAIVGSGPAGFYLTEALFGSGLPVRVDMIERLPVPFGLVRHGVAPDHQKLKAATSTFEQIAGHEHFSFFGNLQVGRDIDIAELLAVYDAVVLATGAISDRSLDIEGEDLAGSVAATDLVGWYNGHPDFRDKIFDFSHPTAVVIGNGNVALDVCRILAKSADELKQSDICRHALEALADSKITDIVLVGRRGPGQAKFTAKELREFNQLAVAEPVIDPEDLVLNSATAHELASPEGAGAARNVQIFGGFSSSQSARGKPKRIHFRFYLAPRRIEGDACAERVIFDRSRLVGPAFAQTLETIGTGTEIATGLVVRSVGYRGAEMPGVPFDMRTATIPNRDGRVVDGDGAAVPRLYVSGWIKRGPSGVIGTNRACGIDTSLAILADLQAQASSPDDEKDQRRATFLASLRGRSRKIVDFAGWRRIDAAERAAGAASAKPREKLTTIPAMIDAAEGRGDRVACV